MKASSIIDLVAPSSSSGLVLDEIKTTIPFFIEQGYKVNCANDLIDPTLIYHANLDEYRSKHFEQLAFDDNSEIIWCVRGGYGAAKVIEYLQKLPAPKQRKILIGFSDITALHLFASQNWGWKCIHGRGFYCSKDQEYADENLSLVLDLLKGNLKKLTIPELKPIANVGNDPIEGLATGGNLSLLQTSIGTKWQLDSANKILLIEDCHERGYKVDRMLLHLHQSGLLKEVKSIIYGDIVGGNEKDGKNHVHYALNQFAKIVNIPIFQTKYFGHGKYNYPFLMNTKGIIKLEAGSYVFEQSVE